MSNHSNNIHRQRRTSRFLIGGAGGRRNVRPCRMQQRTVQFSDMWLQSDDGSWRHRVADRWWRDTAPHIL